METPKPPASSSLRRPSTRPYARRRPKGDSDDAAALDGAAPAAVIAASAEAAVAAVTADIEAPAKKPKSRARSKTKPEPSALPVEAPVIEPAEPVLEAVAIDAGIPTMSAALGALESALASLAEPPAVAVAAVDIIAAVAAISSAEIPALTALPSPRQLPTGAPTDLAPPPGLVPRGDSRSLRRGELFALVYRVHSFVVTRHGHVGQLGHWSAVEYPTPAAASHAYARGCSHWVSEGFSDYRG